MLWRLCNQTRLFYSRRLLSSICVCPGRASICVSIMATGFLGASPRELLQHWYPAIYTLVLIKTYSPRRVLLHSVVWYVAHLATLLQLQSLCSLEWDLKIIVNGVHVMIHYIFEFSIVESPSIQPKSNRVCPAYKSRASSLHAILTSIILKDEAVIL
jgi:hypothetical protein